MKDKILGIISLITVFVPFTVCFFWRPTSPNATAIVIGYCIFIALSFCYALVLFFVRHQRDTYTKIGLGVNGLYLLAVLGLVVIPRLI